MKVGELHAIITADDSKFQSTLNKSKSSWQSFQSTLKSGANTVAGVVQAGTATMMGLTGSLATTGTAYNSLQQNSLQALTTMLGSTEAAHAQLKEFNDFASTSPFGRDTFLRSQQTLLGFGMAAEDIVPTLDAVQNAVAGVGGSNADIEQIVAALAQIESQGKITGQELMRLGNYGIDAAQLIADATGETREEVKKNISASKYDAETTMDAIVSGLQDKFGGAAGMIKEQWTGATDRLKAAWRDMGGDLMAPFIDPNGGGYAVVWANKVADVMRALQSQITPLMDIVVARWGDKFDEAAVQIDKLASKIKAFDISTLNDEFSEVLALASDLAPVLGLLGGAFGGLMTSAGPLVGIFSAFGLSINPVLGAMVGLLLSTEENRDALSGLGDAIVPLLAVGSDLVMTLAEIASEGLDRLVPALINLATAVAEAATPFAGALVPAVEVAVTAFMPFVDMLASVADLLANLPGPVLAGGAAFLALRGNFQALQTSMVGGATKIRGAFDSMRLQAHLGQMEGMSRGGAIAAGGMNRLAGAARKAGTALKGAFANNAVGLAIMAVTTAVSALTTQNAEADRVTEALAGTFDEVTHAATDATYAMIANELASNGIAQEYEAAGGSAQDLISALQGNEDAIQRVNDVLGVNSDQLEKGRSGWDLFVNGADNTGEGMNSLTNKIYDYRQALEQGSEESRLAAEMNERLADSTDGATDATEEAADAAYHAADANRDHIITLQELEDYKRAQANATAAARKAELDYAQALTDAKEAADGNIGMIAEEEYALLDLYDQIIRNVDAQRKDGAAKEDLQALMSTSRADFIEMAQLYGLNAEEAAAYADELGLVPETVQTDAELNTTGAEKDLNDFKGTVDLTTGEIKIDGNSYPAEATLEDLGFEIDSTTGTVMIAGESFEADTTLASVVARISATTESVTIGAQDYPAEEVLSAYITAVNNSSGTVDVGGNSFPADEVRKAILGTINNSSGTLNIDGAAHAARAQTNAARNYVNQSRGYLAVDADDSPLSNWIARNNGRIVARGTYQIGAQYSGATMSWQEDGGVYGPGHVRRMAEGGHLSPRNRQAMFAPAGSYIMWGENETEGETYIPHALSKRRRSTALLAQTARDFGYMLVPNNVTMMADGGRLGMAPTTSGATLNFAPRLTVRIGRHEFDAVVEEIAGGVIDADPAVSMLRETVSGYDREKRARR